MRALNQYLPSVDKILSWHKKNYYYYKDIERLCRFYVSPGARVLEVGVGLGYLLGSVQPSLGTGIDLNPQAIAAAQSRFPELDLFIGNGEESLPKGEFDYILLANTASQFTNIQKAFQNLLQATTPETRIILIYHNPAWELILRFATLIGQRMPMPPLNWLNREDLTNLINLAGLDVVATGKRLLIPKRIPLLSGLVNRYIAPLPWLNSLCLTEYLIARPQASPSHPRHHTCSVIIPARNEAGNIESCVTRMPKLGTHTEIIFIEGHSSDNTWSEIQRVQAEYGQAWDIKIAQQTGKGKGDAVRLGFDLASGDVLMILDADLTVQPEDLVQFYDAVASGRCEMANGCRLIYPVSPQAMPWLNRMANRFFAWLLSYLLNTRIKDSLCGTKVISRKNYQRLAANRVYFGDFDPFGDFDLLFGAAKLGLKIQDIPVRYFPRSYGSSNIQHVKEGLVLLKMCLYAAQKIKFA
ncbi:glycosyltransferase [Pseudocalidococcus azoricus]|uniref:glycosyltransferase n=1 Tax=Pseudocalidococcus azoricus TaxID=3110322 RepID=UPI003899F3C5